MMSGVLSSTRGTNQEILVLSVQLIKSIYQENYYHGGKWRRFESLGHQARMGDYLYAE